MRILKIVGIVVVVLSAAYIGLAAYLPSTVVVERSITMNKYPQFILPWIGRLEQWETWSPRISRDSTLHLTYGETMMGTGAFVSWTSDIGEGGTYTITDIDQDESGTLFVINATLELGKHGRIFKDTWTVEANEDKAVTKVTRALKAEFSFLKRPMGLLMEDRIGPDYEEGLSRLDSVLSIVPSDELQLAPVPEKFKPELSTGFTIVNRKELHTYNIYDTCRIEDLGMTTLNAIREIRKHMLTSKEKPAGPPYCVFYSYLEDEVRFKVGIPLDERGVSKSGRIQTLKEGGGFVLTMIHKGNYDGIMSKHDAMANYVEDTNNLLILMGQPFEEYIKGPFDVQDDSKWITKIGYPVLLKTKDLKSKTSEDGKATVYFQ